MQETTKYQISQLPAAQEVGLELDTNNWCLIRTTHQTTHKLRITWFKKLLKTTKYQISRLRQLKKLGLRYTQITDVQLEQLTKQLTNLE